MACAICGGETVDWLDMPIDAKKDSPTPFHRAVKCRTCETGTIEPKPAPAEIAELYALPSYYTQGASHMTPVAPSVFDKVLTKAAWWLDRARPFEPGAMAARLGAGAKVLDIGCGDAVFLAEFRALGCEVLGVDPDATARTEAAVRGITVLPGTGEALPAEAADASFDLVIMSHSLEHCLDPLRALGAARAKVKPGGLLYVEVPNCGSVHFETMLACSENFDSPRHLWFFTPGGLTTLFGKVGLAPAEWYYHGLTRHHDPSWRGWETEIAARLARHGGKGARRHGRLRSAAMLAREALSPTLARYDAMGVLARA